MIREDEGKDISDALKSCLLISITLDSWKGVDKAARLRRFSIRDCARKSSAQWFCYEVTNAR